MDSSVYRVTYDNVWVIGLFLYPCLAFLAHSKALLGAMALLPVILYFKLFGMAQFLTLGHPNLVQGIEICTYEITEIHLKLLGGTSVCLSSKFRGKNIGISCLADGDRGINSYH